jgi:hypothetical protein
MRARRLNNYIALAIVFVVSVWIWVSFLEPLVR